LNKISEKTEGSNIILNNSDKLLILKRSNKVPMCGLWSAISGRLEKYEQPLQRAKIEILEEVGLTNEQIKLLKIGQVTVVRNTKNDMCWSIYPFLFKTNTNKIKLVKFIIFVWIVPATLTKFKTVPKLYQIFISITHHHHF